MRIGTDHTDPDPQETQEWIDSIDALIAHEGGERAGTLLGRVVTRARAAGVATGMGFLTDYRNTIEPASEPPFPTKRLDGPGAASQHNGSGSPAGGASWQATLPHVALEVFSGSLRSRPSR